YARDPIVTRYLLWHPHRTIKDTRIFLRRCVKVWSAGSSFPYAICLKKSAQLIGMIEMRNQGHKIELGYVLAKAHWGKEYVPEAIKPLIEWAFKQKNVFRVWAICDTDNKASVRVLEKVGMKYEGLLRREII